MNDPQQIRRALGDIRRALDSFSRDALAEVLALVFKEYVLEGQQPMASGANVLDARADIEGMSFPELIVWLQTHVDCPELALFEVSGADVSVRADGRTIRLQARAAAPVAAATAPAPVAPAVTPTPPRPAAATAAPATPAPPAQAAAPAAQPAKEEQSPSDTGTRFSLLEVD
jgi:hypothetical protein